MTRNQKISTTMKAGWADPVKRVKRLASMRSPAASKKYSLAAKARWSDPVMRNKMITALSTPEQIQIRRESGRKGGNNPKSKEALLRAAKAPKKGEKTRINSENHARALNVKFRDPSGKIWYVKNVHKFIREHEYLFSPEDVVWRGSKCKMTAAFTKLTRNVDRRSSSKGWTLVSDTEVFYNNGEDLLERQQYEVHSI